MTCPFFKSRKTHVVWDNSHRNSRPRSRWNRKWALRECRKSVTPALKDRKLMGQFLKKGASQQNMVRKNSKLSQVPKRTSYSLHLVCKKNCLGDIRSVKIDLVSNGDFKGSLQHFLSIQQKSCLSPMVTSRGHATLLEHSEFTADQQSKILCTYETNVALHGPQNLHFHFTSFHEQPRMALYPLGKLKGTRPMADFMIMNTTSVKFILVVLSSINNRHKFISLQKHPSKPSYTSHLNQWSPANFVFSHVRMRRHTA